MSLYEKSFNVLGSISTVFNNLLGYHRLTGLFGTGATLVVDLTIVIQIIMFLFVALSLVYKNQRKFKTHCQLMGVAVILHILSFLIVMLPTFYNGFGYFTTTTSDIIV